MLQISQTLLNFHLMESGSPKIISRLGPIQLSREPEFQLETINYLKMSEPQRDRWH